MKKNIYLLFLLLSLIFVNCLSATNNKISEKVSDQNLMEIVLKLDQINFVPKIKNKIAKDQVYLYITEYSNVNKPKEYRIPTEPKHWLLRNLSKLKKIIIWQNTIKPAEQKTLIISLMRHDAPPLDSDQALGSVKLTINNKQKLQFNWEEAGFDEPIKIYKIIDKKATRKVIFKLINKQGEYNLHFKLNVIKC